MKIIIIIAVVIVLLIGGGLFLSMNKTPQPTRTTQPAATSTVNNNTNTRTNDANNQNAEFEGTLNSLLVNGKSVKCTFSNNTNDINITGIVYAANGKLREDYQSTFKVKEAGVMSGHMIVDSQEVYTWDDQMNLGHKFSFAMPSAGQTNQIPIINKSVMHFSCQPWTFDNSLLILPSNIKFQ